MGALSSCLTSPKQYIRRYQGWHTLHLEWAKLVSHHLSPMVTMWLDLSRLAIASLMEFSIGFIVLERVANLNPMQEILSELEDPIKWLQELLLVQSWAPTSLSKE